MSSLTLPNQTALIASQVGTQQLTVTPYAIELAPSAIRGGIAVFQSIW